MLNPLQMPLINENNDLLTLRLIDGLEKILIAFVNED
jgi:hypothetical protein